MAASKLLRTAQERDRKRLTKAKDAGRDPAVLDTAPPASTGDDAPEKARNSASGKASEIASESDIVTAGEFESKKNSGKVGGSDGEKEERRRPARRRGRPRGPERTMLSVRILAEHDALLTAAVEETGKNPQDLVDEALRLLFRRLKLPREQK